MSKFIVSDFLTDVKFVRISDVTWAGVNPSFFASARVCRG